MMTRTLAALLAATAAAGCYSMAPKYERPAAPVPQDLANFGSGGSGAAGSGSVKDLPWDGFIQDPKLRQIVTGALAQSRSLRQSVLNIEAARAQFRVQRAQRYPSIDGAVGVVATNEFIGIPGSETAQFTEYTATAGTTAWEIDLFGRIKSLTDAKYQTYLQSAETARAAKISLVAELAQAYVTIAADKSRMLVAQDTMAAAKRTMELTDALVGGGTSNRTDYYQAATVFQQARADVASLTAAIAQDHDALDLLAGGHVDDSLLPDALPAAPGGDVQPAGWFAEVPVGMSSSVLLDRPDVLAAEHALMSANANIGAARAAMFPSLSLTGSGGIASAALAALFTGPSLIWTLAPTLSVPIFHGGALRAQLDLSWTQKAIYVAGYELAIQTAFREVADALATRGTIREQLDAQVALVDASQKAYDIARARYQAGVDAFLTTLVAERSLYTAKGSLVATQQAALANRVELYRALGGGG